MINWGEGGRVCHWSPPQRVLNLALCPPLQGRHPSVFTWTCLWCRYVAITLGGWDLGKLLGRKNGLSWGNPAQDGVLGRGKVV